MRKHMIFGTITAVFILGAVAAQAAPFAQEFTLGECVGTCEIAAPGSATFSPAEKGKKCLYGTTLKTGRKSSIAIQLSDGNEFQLLADALAIATEDPTDKTFKVVKLRTGKVDIKLDPSFHKTNKFRVETATAVCGAIGCNFSVEEKGHNTDIRCKEGSIQANGIGAPGWTALMDAGDSLSFTTKRGGFTLTGTGGSFQMVFTSITGETTTVDVTAGTTVTATTEETTDANGRPIITVTLTITTPDGKPRTVTFVIASPEQPKGRSHSITSKFTTGVTVTPVGNR